MGHRSSVGGVGEVNIHEQLKQWVAEEKKVARIGKYVLNTATMKVFDEVLDTLNERDPVAYQILMKEPACLAIFVMVETGVASGCIEREVVKREKSGQKAKGESQIN
jgi:hypothetical protein